MSVLHRNVRIKNQASVLSSRSICNKCGCDCSNYQEGCESTLNPLSALLLPNGLGVGGASVGGRKHSVLFSSYAWNEETIVQSFRDMNPRIGNVLEASWLGENETLQELLNDPETLDLFCKGQLRDLDGKKII